MTDTAGYYVLINFPETTQQDEEDKKLLTDLRRNGFVDLKSLRALHIATKNEYRKTIDSAKRKEKAKISLEKRKLYYEKPEVQQKRKEYNSREEVKQRKKELQARRSAIVKKLRETNPELYAKLMYAENGEHYKEESSCENEKSEKSETQNKEDDH